MCANTREIGRPGSPPPAVAGVATAVVGAAINPLGVLIPLVSAGAADKNPCLAALQGAAARPAATSATGGGQQAKPNQQEGGVKGILKGLGGTLDKLLGTNSGN